MLKLVITASMSLNHNKRFPFDHKTRLAIFAQGELAGSRSKTAQGLLRYVGRQVVCVIDSTKAGQSLEAITGIKHPGPIVSDIKESLAYKPQAIVIGIALSGGKLPLEWRHELKLACSYKLDIINGLHDFLSEDKEFSALAQENSVNLIDLRKPPEKQTVATGLSRNTKAKRILTVGSDCSSGKMTVAVELTNLAVNQKHKASFIATGQTGILVAGGVGVGIDRVIGDFMAGAIEDLVVEQDLDNDFLFIEGQGSIFHPGFSGVTLAILHGSCPDGLILCHNAKQLTIKEGDIVIPDLKTIINTYESLTKPIHAAKVVGIALNTRNLDENEAKDLIAEVESETGLVTCDPVRFGAGRLLQIITDLV